MKIKPTKFMWFHGVFMDISWALYKGFYCSLSEAQKGAEDKGQIKAQLGGMPVRETRETRERDQRDQRERPERPERPERETRETRERDQRDQRERPERPERETRERDQRDQRDQREGGGCCRQAAL